MVFSSSGMQKSANKTTNSGHNKYISEWGHEWPRLGFSVSILVPCYDKGSTICAFKASCKTFRDLSQSWYLSQLWYLALLWTIWYIRISMLWLHMEAKFSSHSLGNDTNWLTLPFPSLLVNSIYIYQSNRNVKQVDFGPSINYDFLGNVILRFHDLRLLNMSHKKGVGILPNQSKPLHAN